MSTHSFCFYGKLTKITYINIIKYLLYLLCPTTESQAELITRYQRQTGMLLLARDIQQIKFRKKVKFLHFWGIFIIFFFVYIKHVQV